MARLWFLTALCASSAHGPYVPAVPRSQCGGCATCPGSLWLKAVIGPGTAGGALALQWPFLPFRSRSMPGSPRYRCPHSRWLVSTARPGYDGFCRVPSSYPAATGAGSSGCWADVTCFSQFGHVTGPFCQNPTLLRGPGTVAASAGLLQKCIRILGMPSRHCLYLLMEGASPAHVGCHEL